jgi:hypothetical protein
VVKHVIVVEVAPILRCHVVGLDGPTKEPVLLQWLALGDGRRITLTGACAFSAPPPRRRGETDFCHHEPATARRCASMSRWAALLTASLLMER